ncbi:protein-glutamate O-methyltransferase CheR [Nitratireductor sp. ZSWI3]|uniref:CheR family methyltransferase n=1 Tax=Nitratireductor sp. ZSWI3 TaxID=2966359 RepID=UPI00214F8CB0|nr:CheR family methyltransferase [Nitratireductor sp. ZSWI3]MCR4264723.1 protein-glutamate O-methyltransferase CheR [Nitratireductor sp. ZSWI3]
MTELMERHGIDHPAFLRERLKVDPALADEVIAEVTIGETYFFRDPAQFDLIRDEVLPHLLRARPEGSPLKIWSAGCSTGEEVYSLAILAEQMGLGEKVQIIGTDVSGRALHQAAAARYRCSSLRGEASKRAMPYLAPHGDRLHLREHLKGRARFFKFCLGRDELPAPTRGLAEMDLILCRNVLIYMEPDAIRRIARQFYQCLGDGGWLLLGPSDPPLWEHAPFATYVTRAGVLYRRGALRQSDDLACGEAPARSKASGSVPGDAPPALERIGEAATISARLKEASLGSAGEGAIARRIRSLLHKEATGEAAALAAKAVRKHPLSVRLHYLHGSALLAARQYEDAAAAFRRLLYLDRSLAAAHFFLGRCHLPGNRQAALHAFEEAHALCVRRPHDERVELMEDVTAGQLVLRIGSEIADVRRSIQEGSHVAR